MFPPLVPFLNTLYIIWGEIMRNRKRKGRRVQYAPQLVVVRVLHDDFLRTLTYLVYSAKLPMSAGELARKVSGLLGRTYGSSYVSAYLKRLEKWGVVRPYRNPANGHLLWWPAETRTAEMVRSELERSEVKKVLESVEGALDGTGSED